MSSVTKCSSTTMWAELAYSRSACASTTMRLGSGCFMLACSLVAPVAGRNGLHPASPVGVAARDVSRVHPCIRHRVVHVDGEQCDRTVKIKK